MSVPAANLEGKAHSLQTFEASHSLGMWRSYHNRKDEKNKKDDSDRCRNKTDL